ncbi:pitrilysin family protein [Uliginosibacterium paludis]|uniref:Pitrilysin family protein n=1 Tax=Uliginosibacterium paludis TaxID=1615952 RepID=A0ABV2CS99_9RHOO
MTARLLLCLLFPTLLVQAALAATPSRKTAEKTVPAAEARPAPGPAALPVRSLEGITEYRLANGLRILLAPDSSKPTTTLNITYLVGSRHEGYGETGMAHLLEHLLFKGTPSLPGGALTAGLKQRGMQFNGTTAFDRTNYFETFTAGDENLDWALTMEADRMVNSFIARSDLDSEMSVVRNEMERGENSPVSTLRKQVTGLAFQWHNYGKSTIGARSDVENVVIERLQTFYRKYYQPDNAVLILTGKFDTADALARIQQRFGAIPRPSRTLEPTWTREPPQEGERTTTLRRAGDQQVLTAIYHVPNGAHPDLAALDVLGSVLASSPGGRLNKALVDTGKLTYVGAGAMALAEPGYFIVQALFGKQVAAGEVRQRVFDIIDAVRTSPPSPAEMQRVQTAHANAFDRLIANPQALGISLSESVALGDWRLLFLRRDQIAAVSAADVQRVAATYLKASNRSVGQFIPEDTPDRVQMPAEARPDEALANYTGRKALESGEAFDPTPANIEQRTTRYMLDNGARLALLAKKNRGETVSGRIVLRMGDEQSLAGQREQIRLMAVMLMRGTNGADRERVAERLHAAHSQVSIGTWYNSLIVNFESRRESLSEFLPLLAEILRQPDFPGKEFDVLRAQQLAALEAVRREPDALAPLEAARQGSPYPEQDLRYRPSINESMAGLRSTSVRDLTSLHRNFLGAQDAQFSLVGDFDEQAVRQQLAELFGDWRAQKPSANLPLPWFANTPASLQLETPDKANARLVGILNLPLGEASPDMPALELMNAILGGSGLSSRLANRVRQKEGISYTINSTLNLHEKSASGVLTISASFAPENRERLLGAVQDELARLVSEGVSKTELRDARKGLLEQRRLARSNDANLARMLSTNLWLERDMGWQAGVEQQLEAVTPEQLNAVIRQYLDPARFTFVVAGDFARVAGAK